VKAIRSYRHEVGSFPKSFVELEARVCRHNHPPNFGNDGLFQEREQRRKSSPLLALDEIKRLPGIPEPAQLALLGLTEQ
jgi:hypothetical protein